MIKPCDICGDLGVIEAIIICCQCKVAREHLYCMRVFRTQAPQRWCCEECDQNKLVLPKTTDNEHKTQKVSSLMQQTALLKEGQNKNRIPSQFNFKEKWVDKGRTKYLSCDEAVRLSSGSMKLNCSQKEFRSEHGMPKSMPSPRVFQQSTGLKVEKATTSTCERTHIKSPQEERSFKPNLQQHVFQQAFGPKEKATSSACGRTRIKSPQEERKFNPNLQQPVFQQSFGPKEKTAVPFQNRGNGTRPVKFSMPSGRVEGTNPERDTKTTKNEPLPPQKAADISRHIEVPRFLKKHEKSETSGCKNHDDLEAGRSNAGKPNLTSGLHVSEMHDPYIPSSNPYWKGCFYLPNGPQKFNEEFKAHPPSKTHYKVYETVKKLPPNIYFELVSNHELRMEIFPADRDDIGLYFFPMSKSRSEHGIFIIDFIWRNNLVMKSNVEGLELFVLSSRVLPSHAQEFQGNYFLWGVFRRPKTATKVAVAKPDDEDDDVPPGFKKIYRQ